MELIRKNKFTNLSQLGTRPEFVKFILPFSCAFPGTVHTFPALYTTRTLLFNNSGVFPGFSSSERFSSIPAAFAPLFIVCKFSSFLYHLHFSCALVQFTLLFSLPPPPPFVRRCVFPFFLVLRTLHFVHFRQFTFFLRPLSFTPAASFPILKVS